jgi:hypothetical protein
MPVILGNVQDSMAAGPAGGHGPGFSLLDERRRPLFWFVFKNHDEAQAAATLMAEILKNAIDAGRSP